MTVLKGNSIMSEMPGSRKSPANSADSEDTISRTGTEGYTFNFFMPAKKDFVSSVKEASAITRTGFSLKKLSRASFEELFAETEKSFLNTESRSSFFWGFCPNRKIQFIQKA